MAKQKCEVCTRTILVQIFKNTGFCSALCEKKQKGKKPKQADIKSVVE